MKLSFLSYSALLASSRSTTMSLSVTASSNDIMIRDTFNREAFHKGFHTVQTEECYEIEGNFPTDIMGTFFQNGHAKFQVGEEIVVHPFDGDGMVTAVTFSKGKAWFRNRFVQTPGYVEELNAGKVRYRGMFGTAKNKGAWWSNIFDLKTKNLANTHVLYSNNHLYALWEGGKPFQLRPDTLQTIGDDAVDLEGSLGPAENYAAHYKIDPDSGNIVNFAVGQDPSVSDPSKGHMFTVYEHSGKDLKLIRKRKFALPGFGLAHDMAISKNYVCAFQAPVKFNVWPFVLGKKSVAECILSDKEATTAKIFLLPRTGKEEVLEIEIPVAFTFHLSNAFEDEDGTFVVDAIMADDVNFADTESNKYPERPLWETFDLTTNAYQLRRYRIDLAQRKLLSVTTMSNDASANVEFPVIHPKYVSKAYQYVYVGAGASTTVGQPIQGISKIDVQQGRTVQKWLPESVDEFIGEVCFVPRGDTEEDDGYLLAYKLNGIKEETTLCVFDCRNIAKGPICEAPIPTFLSFALHGAFVPGYVPDFNLTKQSFSER